METSHSSKPTDARPAEGGASLAHSLFQPFGRVYKAVRRWLLISPATFVSLVFTLSTLVCFRVCVVQEEEEEDEDEEEWSYSHVFSGCVCTDYPNWVLPLRLFCVNSQKTYMDSCCSWSEPDSHLIPTKNHKKYIYIQNTAQVLKK